MFGARAYVVTVSAPGHITRRFTVVSNSLMPQRVHVDLDRVVEEAVEQHRRLLAHLDRLAHVALEVLVAVDDLHRPAAEHVARTNDERVADFLRENERLLTAAGFSVLGVEAPAL